MSAIKLFFWLLLGCLLTGSALAVVYSKYRCRLLFLEIKKQERYLDEEAIKWGQLQLEITTLTSENRIEMVAGSQLNLGLPTRESTIYVKIKP